MLITFALAMIQEMCARMGVVTQKGLGELIRENFGVKWTMFALSTLFVANLATTVAEFAGIAASLEIFHISRYFSVPVTAAVIWIVVVKGSFKFVERVLLGLSLVYIAYVVSGVMAHPNWHEVMRATVTPHLSASPGFLFLAIAVIGTTITPWMQFFLQSTVVDKGLRIESYVYEKWDVDIGSFLSDLVAFFIVVACGATIHASGAKIETAADAAIALRPLAGNYAAILFAVGLFSASLLSAAVLPLSTAYTYCEAFGWEIWHLPAVFGSPDILRMYTLTILFGALVVLSPNLGLIDAMVNSQAVCGILLPVILVFMLKLINRRDVMGNYTNSRIFNIIVWAMAVILIVMTVAWPGGLIMGYK